MGWNQWIKKPQKESALRSASLKKETKKKPVSSEDGSEGMAGPQRPRTADLDEQGLSFGEASLMIREKTL